jgi:hypothetical protein
VVVDRERPRQYGVNAHDRAPLIQFMLDALRREGCRIIHEPSPDRAPFRITFETPSGERMGIMVYAFLATFTPTRNRPDDEHSFQIKYGTKDGKLHDIWQDPFDLYVTLFLGINPDQGFFVAADPVLHSPTKFFIRLEFKQKHVDQILRHGWFAWERPRFKPGEPVEVLVGGRASSFLRLIRFEREARGEDQGHRQLLAEQLATHTADLVTPRPALMVPSPPRLHELARELELSETEVLDVIAGARRLKMAVRGWVAEEHLVRSLKRVPGVTECERLDEEGGVDVRLRYQGSRPLAIECKNVLRERTAAGLARLDFQRTRASKGDPCSRYYSPRDFDVVAACLHAVTLRWEFQFAPTGDLDVLGQQSPCAGKLSHLVKLDERWSRPVETVLREVAKG